MNPTEAQRLASVVADAVTIDGVTSPYLHAGPAESAEAVVFDKPDRFDYTVDGYARHLGGILDQLGVHRAHLVLHDFGGPWGLTWAAQHPDRFASVTLVNVGVLRGYRWHYLARIWRTPVLGEVFLRMTTRPAVRLLLRHGNPSRAAR